MEIITLTADETERLQRIQRYLAAALRAAGLDLTTDEFRIEEELDPLVLTIGMSGISIMADEIETPSFSGPRRAPGWTVIEWKYSPATREQPEDVWGVPLSSHVNTGAAAAAAVLAVVQRRIDAALENEDYHYDPEAGTFED